MVVAMAKLTRWASLHLLLVAEHFLDCMTTYGALGVPPPGWSVRPGTNWHSKFVTYRNREPKGSENIWLYVQ